MLNNSKQQTIIQLLLNAKVHLGYKQQYNQENAFYVLGHNKKNTIFDLNKTLYALNRSFKFLVNAISNFQTVLVLSENNMFLKNYCLYNTKYSLFYWDFKKWYPGFLTNFDTIFLDFKQKQFKLLESESEFLLKNLKYRPQILLVFDAYKYQDAIEEAYKLNIPVIAIADTNCNQELLSKITYVIPGNTSSLRSIFFFTKVFIKAEILGRKRYFKKKHQLEAILKNKQLNEKINMALDLKKKTRILAQTRTNFWGGLKILKFKKLKWVRIKRQLKVKPQYLRFYNKRLKPQQQFLRRRYKKLLTRKQHFKSYYGNLKESQLKKIFKDTRKKINYKHTHLDLVISHLEQRLDMVVFRMNFATSVDESRNMILHGKVLVNGFVVRSYNFQIKKNDIISIHPSYKYVIFQKIAQSLYTNYLYYLLTLFPRKYNKKFRQHRRVFSNDLFNNVNSTKTLLSKKVNKRGKNKRKFFKNKKKYNLSIKNKLFLYKYKDKQLLKHLNTRSQKYFFDKKHLNFFQLLNTNQNVIVNFNNLIGIFLFSYTTLNAPFHSFMGYKDVQRFYNRV